MLVPVMRVLALTFPIRAAGSIAEVVLQRSLQFRVLSAIDVGSYVAGYAGVGISMALMGFGVWALIWAQMGQAVARSALLLHRVRGTVGLSLRRSARRFILTYGSGLTTAQIANAVAQNGDNAIVGRALGAADLGVYSRAYQLVVAPAALLANVLDRVLFPVIAQIRQDRTRVAWAFETTVALSALMMLPASALLAALAPEVVVILLGPQWMETVAPLRVLAAGLMFRTTFQLGDSLARSLGAAYQSSWRQAVYALAVVGGAWAGSHWGLAGVAAGVLCALFIKFMLMLHLATRLTQVRWKSLARAHVSGAALALSLGAVAELSCRLLRHVTPVPLLVAVGAASICTAAAVFLAASFPAMFLGASGVWMRNLVSERLRSARGHPSRTL